jgi:hypothetical protein
MTPDPDSQRLAKEKQEARERLLAMPPEIAQQLVDQTLYPQFWSYTVEDLILDESIPTHYGEIDA